MPIFNYKCTCGNIEEKLSGSVEEDKHCSKCGEFMERQSVFAGLHLLNRQKPRGFKFYPQEMNPDKDIWYHLKCREEAGKPIPRDEKEYYYRTLKDKVGA